MHTGRELGVPDGRIRTVAPGVDGVTAANGSAAPTGALDGTARLVAAGRLRVPVAATFPVEELRCAVELQVGRHVHGEVVVAL
ncbi:MAG TPA: zinc-binding dehydrogenase [Pseudonocardia sp.]|uniref:zinc-binding dehydrogenase n=1 Tax=Pseudonocardia sp. TaxID=60912 RepID=UPI002B4B74EB|nr:zinc-binding dehydrogenase [Pseudonocardia sp.]HLU55937.1 zinc-binding dehydrogenase [Pseudonocardia sp.]